MSLRRLGMPQGTLTTGQKSAEGVLCAGQRMNQEGSSPSGARMRGAVSKGGGNASLAGERREGMEKPKRARKRKLETDQGRPEATIQQYSGGQGAHCT